jgi:membrane protein DedA with SNARE-associated domain
MGLQQFLIQHGLLAVLLVATVEGDLSVIVAGAVAHLGFFPFLAAIVAGAVGNFLGDCTWYLLGRFASVRIRNTRVYRKVGPTVEKLARRFGVWQLLAARVVYGTRNASMVFWGLHHLGFGRFTLVDAFGCLLWSSVFAGLGYLASDRAEAWIGQVKQLELWLLGAVIVAAVLVYLVNRLARRELHTEASGPET